MKQVFILAPTIIGGACYEVSHLPQSVPDEVADHLIQIGNATLYETKIVEVAEKKPSPSSVPPPDPVSPPQTAPTPRRGRR